MEKVEKANEDMTLDEMKKLQNAKVVKVWEFENGHFDSGIVLEFDNGMKITAQDGEYGDNTFREIVNVYCEHNYFFDCEIDRQVCQECGHEIVV